MQPPDGGPLQYGSTCARTHGAVALSAMRCASPTAVKIEPELRDIRRRIVCLAMTKDARAVMASLPLRTLESVGKERRSVGWPITALASQPGPPFGPVSTAEPRAAAKSSAAICCVRAEAVLVPSNLTMA